MDRVLQRRDTAARWASMNPVLAEGEIGIITDGGKGYKIGDGVTHWNDLEYPSNPTSVVGTIGDSEVAAINQKGVSSLVGLDTYPVFSESMSYVKGEIVNYGGLLYEFTADHEAGAWIGTDAMETSLRENFSECINNIYTDYLGNPYIFTDRYVSANTGQLTIDDTHKMCATDFLPITRNQDIKVRGVAVIQESVAPIAFYDSNKMFISAIRTYNPSRLYIVEKDNIPKEARFIRCTYNPSNDNVYITGVNLLSILGCNDVIDNKMNSIVGDLFTLRNKLLERSNGLMFDVDESIEGAVTDYLPIDRTSDLYLYGYESDRTSICCFYDYSRRFIKSVDSVSKLNKVDVYYKISKEDIPANAYFIRVSGRYTKHPFVIGTISNKILYDRMQDGFESILGNFFNIKNKYIRRIDGVVANAGESVNRAITDYLPIDKDINIVVYGYESDGASICCFYDKDKKFIRSVPKSTEDVSADTKITILKEDIPIDAKYIRCSGTYTKNPYIMGASTLSVLTKDYIRNLSKGLTVLMTGASFAYSGNGWFELSMNDLGYTGINKAVSGSSIVDLANILYNGGWSDVNYENIDVLAIMHVHNYNVNDSIGIKTTIEDYESSPFSETLLFNNSTSARSDVLYSQAYDYVLKKWDTICYNLRTDINSKWYNTKSGKPVSVILCTHWHDARVRFNNSIRELSSKWGYPICDFASNIGFSKNQVCPATGDQVSVLYCDNGSQDTEVIDGIVYGLHPSRGKDKYIQQKISNIFSFYLNKYKF